MSSHKPTRALGILLLGLLACLGFMAEPASAARVVVEYEITDGHRSAPSNAGAITGGTLIVSYVEMGTILSHSTLLVGSLTGGFNNAVLRVASFSLFSTASGVFLNGDTGVGMLSPTRGYPYTGQPFFSPGSIRIDPASAGAIAGTIEFYHYARTDAETWVFTGQEVSRQYVPEPKPTSLLLFAWIAVAALAITRRRETSGVSRRPACG